MLLKRRFSLRVYCSSLMFSSSCCLSWVSSLTIFAFKASVTSGLFDLLEFDNFSTQGVSTLQKILSNLLHVLLYAFDVFLRALQTFFDILNSRFNSLNFSLKFEAEVVYISLYNNPSYSSARILIGSCL